MSETTTRATNVFISYSRRDSEAAERLHAALVERGFNPYLDKHDIAAGEDWKARLGGLIEATDKMVFLISPDSVASEICDWEINHAELLGKRVLPVVTRETVEVPERLQRLNYVFMRTPEEEGAHLPSLTDALAVDIAWIRGHTHYGEMAGRWDAAGRPGRLLLRGASIGEAEHWRDSRPATAPRLTETQSAFIAASRRAASGRQRNWITGSLAVAALAVGLSTFAFIQQQAAEASRKETVTVLATSDLRQGTQLVAEPQTAAEGTAFLARAAQGGDARAQTRLWAMLQQRSFWLPTTVETADEPATKSPIDPPQEIIDRFSTVNVQGTPQKATNIAMSGDGRRVFVAVGNVINAEPVMIAVFNRDGTVYRDWWQPPYDGLFYIDHAKGTLNSDGRYLAVEVQGWRETSRIIVYDLQNGRSQLSGDIVASGLLPQTQSMGFTNVSFVETPNTAPRGINILLVTAAAKGDAAVYGLSGKEFHQVAQNRHRAAVTAADIDPDTQWLMSGDADGTIAISTLYSSEQVGNLIPAEGVPQTLRRGSSDQVLVETTPNGWSAYSLTAPVERPTSPVPPLVAEGRKQEACLPFKDASGQPPNRLEHPSGLVLTREDERHVGVARNGGATHLSPALASDIDVVCASDDGNTVTITTTDFRTEFWASDFATRIGSILDERAWFGEGRTPERTDWVALSPDGKYALVRSSFWDPPNLEVFWISLWDVESGLPLMDRLESADDGLTDGVIRSARFTTDGAYLTFIGDETAIPRSLEINPPAALAAVLPSYLEAVTNSALNNEGFTEPVGNRTALLETGQKAIQEFAVRSVANPPATRQPGSSSSPAPATSAPTQASPPASIPPGHLNGTYDGLAHQDSARGRVWHVTFEFTGATGTVAYRENSSDAPVYCAGGLTLTGDLRWREEITQGGCDNGGLWAFTRTEPMHGVYTISTTGSSYTVTGDFHRQPG